MEFKTTFKNISSEDLQSRLSELGVRVPPESSSEVSPEKLDSLLRRALAGLDTAAKQTNWISPIVLSGRYEVFDFTKGYDPSRKLRFPYGWGRYDEDRVGMYNAEFFKNGVEPRTIHMGVDLGAPAGTSVFAPIAARLHATEFRGAEGDYGGTIILKADAFKKNGLTLFLLFGHLSRASLKLAESVECFHAGDLLGWVGEKHENGGWNPHLHLQLSWLEPIAVDLPGAVNASNRSLACAIFPDPSVYLQQAWAGWPTLAATLA